MTDLLIPYGEKNGHLYHVDEVPRGLDCGCYCPSCGGHLVARQGAQKQWHFAHYFEPVDCGYERQPDDDR